MTLEDGFGKVLRDLRRAKKLTQEGLADASGCHRAHVSFLERGLKSPTLHMLFQLATALDVSPHEVVKRVEEEVEANASPS